MKKYIKSVEEISDSDFFGITKLSAIIIVDDARNVDSSSVVTASTNEEWYTKYDANELISLDDGTVRNIKSIEVIHNINELYREHPKLKNPLSARQKQRLGEWYKLGNASEELTKTEKKALVDLIHNSIKVNKPYIRTGESEEDQNKNYSHKYDLDMNVDDYLMILKHLQPSDYIRTIRSGNPKHLGNRLTEFIINGKFELHNGKITVGEKLYIKIEQLINNQTIVLISFHEPQDS